MKIYNYIKLVIFVLFAILVVVLRETLLENLRYLVSALLLAFGVESILVIGITKKKECIKEYRFIYGFVEVLLGIIVVSGVSSFESICIIWAVWAMSRESFEIYEILNKKIVGVIAIISFIESIVVYVLSTMMIFTPTHHHAEIHIYLLIAELIITAFSPVLSEIAYRVHEKRKKNKTTPEQ